MFMAAMVTHTDEFNTNRQRRLLRKVQTQYISSVPGSLDSTRTGFKAAFSFLQLTEEDLSLSF